MGFLRQEYWSGLPFPSPGDLPDTQRREMSKCYWKNGAGRLAWWRVAINLWFVKNAMSAKCSKVKHNKVYLYLQAKDLPVFAEDHMCLVRPTFNTSLRAVKSVGGESFRGFWGVFLSIHTTLCVHLAFDLLKTLSKPCKSLQDTHFPHKLFLWFTVCPSYEWSPWQQQPKTVDYKDFQQIPLGRSISTRLVAVLV